MIFHQTCNSLGKYAYNSYFYTDTKYDFHFHKNLELIYVLKGGLEVTVNNRTERLTTGDFALCLSYEIHSFIPEDNSLFWVLVFSEDYVRTFSNQIRGKQGDGFVFRCDKDTEEYIKSRLIYNKSPQIYTLKSCLYAICEAYLNQIKLTDVANQKRQLLPMITDYIHDNFQKNITLSDIAEKFGYDYHYISRFFNSFFNMSFSNFLNLYRLEYAIQFLEESEKSITEIALESGFQSVRSFNHYFKKSTNASPSQYRKQFKK